jgi:L-iditol 2-dehydrogenase
MKALTLSAPNELRYGEVPDPEVHAGEVLIDVRACGVCGSDIHGMDGSSGRRIPPIIMGHEAAGTIGRVGAGVTGWSAGDRVTFDSTIYCGTCAYCGRGQVNLCDRRRVLGVSCDDYRQPGAFAARVVVPAHIVHRLPDGVTFIQGALVEPLAIALHAISRLGDEIEGPVVVVGAGVIGLMVIQALHARGIDELIAVDIDGSRLERARGLGAQPVTGGDPGVVAKTVSQMLSDREAGIVFDAVGMRATVELAVGLTRKGGSVVLVGNLAPRVDLPLQAVVTRELTLLGSATSAGEFPLAIAMIAEGRIDVGAMVSAVVPLREGGPWMHRLQAGDPSLLKVIFEP